MLEGLREALEYIADLKEKSMDVKMEEIDGKIYCNKNLTRYHNFDTASEVRVNTLTALVDCRTAN